jgi:hypothetical protein
MIPLLALIASCVVSIITATAYLTTRLSAQDTKLTALHEDIAEVKGALLQYQSLSERVAVLEFQAAHTGKKA